MAYKKHQQELKQVEHFFSAGKKVGYDHRRQEFNIVFECENGHSVIESDVPPFNNRDEAIIYGKTKSSFLKALCALVPENLPITSESRCKQPYKFKEVQRSF